MNIMNPVEIKAIIDRLAPLCRIATVHDTVSNSECAYSFHSPYNSKGILVNLQTFVATAEEFAFQRSVEQQEEFTRNQSVEDGLFVRIEKKRVAIEADAFNNNTASPVNQFVTRLGIGIEGGFQSDEQKFETISTYHIVLLRNKQDGTVISLKEYPHIVHDSLSDPSSLPIFIRQSADSVILHTGTAVQQDLSAWELNQEPKPISKYAENLPFVFNGVTISPNPKDWKVCTFV